VNIALLRINLAVSINAVKIAFINLR